MTLPEQLAKHIRDVFFGGNWTCVNLQKSLEGLTWQQAITQVHSFNTIATLVNHIAYYIPIITKVLAGGPLEGKDELSFSHPPIECQEDWDSFVANIFTELEALAVLVAALPESILLEPFTDEKYGTYYRNLAGFVEHTHYHLGQITFIEKLLSEQSAP